MSSDGAEQPGDNNTGWRLARAALTISLCSCVLIRRRRVVIFTLPRIRARALFTRMGSIRSTHIGMREKWKQPRERDYKIWCWNGMFFPRWCWELQRCHMVRMSSTLEWENTGGSHMVRMSCTLEWGGSHMVRMTCTLERENVGRWDHRGQKARYHRRRLKD